MEETLSKRFVYTKEFDEKYRYDGSATSQYGRYVRLERRN